MDITEELKKIVASNEELKKEQFRDLSPYIITQAELSKEDIPKKKYKPGTWSDLSLSARDGRIVVHINGQKTAELLNDKGRTSGHIGLQLHGGDTMDVEFKALAILTPKK